MPMSHTSFFRRKQTKPDIEFWRYVGAISTDPSSQEDNIPRRHGEIPMIEFIVRKKKKINE